MIKNFFAAALLLALVTIFVRCGAGFSDTVEVDSGFGGTYSISGVVSLPSSATAGKLIEIQIISTGNTMSDATHQTANGTSINYNITHLPAGTYYVQVSVDQVGNQRFSDSGDFDGYYNGTVASPITNFASATSINVSNSSVLGVDFGLGVLP